MGNIYISYSQNNKDAAIKIRDALDAWEHTVWMDDPDDEFDRALAEQLDRALRQADILVALLSPTSVKSRTVRREIALAKSLNKKIIPVLVEPLPTVSEEESSKYIDATTNLDGAISRLSKAVDARLRAAPAMPSSSLPEIDVDAEAADEEERNPLVFYGLIAAIAIAIILGIIALTRGGSSVTSEADLTSTAVQSIADAGATEAAMARATVNAQAMTIAVLEQTQAAINHQLTLEALATDTPTPEPTATATAIPPSPTEAPDSTATQATAGEVASPSVTVAPASPTVSPLPTNTSAGPTEDPSPTAERLETGNTASPTSDGVASVPSPTNTSAPPTVPAPVDRSQLTNLLFNPSFESFAVLNQTQRIAQGWSPWSVSGDNLPSYQQAPVYASTAPNSARIRDGINGQTLQSQFTTHDGGIFQQVSGITPGTTLRFSVYAYVWSSTFADLSSSEGEGGVQVQVGIDPTGGTDPQSANIFWSPPEENYDSYREYAIAATAANSVVTVFIRSSVDFPVQNTFIYLDEALLYQSGA